jgi:hypothetical protein
VETASENRRAEGPSIRVSPAERMPATVGREGAATATRDDACDRHARSARSG